MAIESSQHWVVSEFEGTLLKKADLFSYFTLMAYEASSIIRSTTLLFLWPIIALLDVFGYSNAALKLMIFISTARLREPEIELVARAVLPKFYMDDVSMDTWRVFSSCKKRVVVTRMPRVMVEWFAKEHFGADEVIGTELIVNRFGFVTGFIRETDVDQSALNRVADLFVDRRPHLGLGRPRATTFLPLCEEQIIAPVQWNHREQQLEVQPPKPVIFHDGRFVKRPTPGTALVMLLWLPFGFILATIRIYLLVLPFGVIPYISGILGVRVKVKGKPPQPPEAHNSGLIFVANHRTILDSFILSYAVGQKVPSVTYSALPQFLSPIPLVWISRSRDTDTEIIKKALSKGNVAIFPEGTTCRQPILLRFSALFAELSDEIVPVAIQVTAGFYSACARGWNGLDTYSWFMNPTLVFEVTFLDQLPVKDTCSSGKTPYVVANHVQRILGDTLGFECTNLTRKDKYKVLT